MDDCRRVRFPTLSELLYGQAGDAAEVAKVARGDGITEFYCAGPDDQIGEREINSLGGLFSADPSNDFSRS
jgi:hypothetical protein